MMTELGRDSLDEDRTTLIFEVYRGTLRLHGQKVAHLLNRCGVERRQWDHLTGCWMVPIREMPALLALAEKDHRHILIEDGAA